MHSSVTLKLTYASSSQSGASQAERTAS
jgi:hypothetical protein